MKSIAKIIGLILLTLFLGNTAKAQQGTVDSTFGLDGLVMTPLSTAGAAICRNLIALPNGKIIATGTSYTGLRTEFTLVRYHNNGSLDSLFGINGVTTTSINNSASSMSYCSVVQPDGKILLGGDFYSANGYSFAVIRYDSSGQLDTAFGDNGIAICQVGATSLTDNIGNAIGLQSDGKIVLAGGTYNAGGYDFTSLRFNTDGSLDSSYGTFGVVLTAIGAGNDNCYSMAIQPDDKIILGGDIEVGSAYQFALVRYTADGILDNTFGNAGIRIDSLGANDDDYGYSLLVQADKKIILGGTAKTSNNYDFALMRFDSTGVRDANFGIGGLVVTEFNTVTGGVMDVGHAMTLQADGKILLAGKTYLDGSEFGLVRYNTDGSLDNTFGSAGRVVFKVGSGQHNCYGICIDNNDKIIIGGQVSLGLPDNFILVRFNSGIGVGIEDPAEANLSRDEFTPYPNPFNTGITIPNADKITSVVIFDVTGKTMYRSQNSESVSALHIPTASFAPGIYLVQMQTQDQFSFINTKLVKY